jgi:predicted permease
MLTELRFALRSLRRSPSFLVVAILSLAIGIGANTAIFSLFQQVLLRSLPVTQPDRLVIFHTEGQDPGSASADNFDSVYSYPQYREFRDRSTVFSGVIARSGGGATVIEPSGASNASVDLVSGNFFTVLGVSAVAGRTLLPSDESAPGANPVVVLGHAYWTRHFGADPAVLNTRILINGHPMLVVGILSPRFLGIQSGRLPDLYAPISMKDQISPGWKGFDEFGVRWLNLFARLKPGMTPASAQAATQVLFKAVRAEYVPKLKPMTPRTRQEFDRRTVELRPASQGINLLSEFWRAPLRVLLAMVSLVLLIACANFAGLLLARAAARQKEIAVRVAVGAGRLALVRQWLSETLVVTLTAGILGLLLAVWSVAGLLRLLDENEGWVSARLDWQTFAYTFAIALAAGILFACAPLWQARRLDLVTALKENSGATTSSARQRLRKALVVGQIALALVLLAGAGLFVRTLRNLKEVDPGFRPASLLSFALEPRLNSYDKPREQASLRDLRARLAALPGVERVATSDTGPFMHSRNASGLYVQGYTAAPDEDPGTDTESVSAGYFKTLGVPLIAGREFDERDTAAAPKVAIINEALAKKYFQNRNPIGFRIGTDKEMQYQVIGVARDFRRNNLREPADPFLYFVSEQQPTDTSVFFVRGYGANLASAARSVVAALDPNLPILDMKTMEARVEESVNLERAIAALAAAFGLAASLLAAVGLYGVIAYSVTRRTPEIGVRIALGATRREVFRLVFQEVAMITAIGVTAGLLLAAALARLVQSQLFGVQPYDPLTVTGALVVLMLIIAAAAFFPARRAAGVDPVTALRSE